MDTQNFLTTISVLAQEIEMIRYQKDQLMAENHKLREMLKDACSDACRKVANE